MKRVLAFLVLAAAFFSCTHQYQVMGREQFSEVDIGTPEKVLVRTYGPPYAVHSKKGDQEVYEYLERLNIGNQTVQYKRYFFLIENGIVIGKYVKVTNPPPFEKIYSDDPFENTY